MERKEFLMSAYALCGFGIASGILSGCSKQPISQPKPGFTIDLTSAAYASLSTVGSAQLVNQVYVINIDGTNFSAVSSVCTHNGCTIGFQSLANGFACPCHGATFTTAGIVTGGPAPSNLTTYTVTKNGNMLTIA